MCGSQSLDAACSDQSALKMSKLQDEGCGSTNNTLLRDGGKQRATNNIIPASLKSTDVRSEEALVTMEIERLHRKRAEGFLSSERMAVFYQGNIRKQQNMTLVQG